MLQFCRRCCCCCCCCQSSRQQQAEGASAGCLGKPVKEPGCLGCAQQCAVGTSAKVAGQLHKIVPTVSIALYTAASASRCCTAFHKHTTALVGSVPLQQMRKQTALPAGCSSNHTKYTRVIM
jgi:hypothetical protein